MTQITKRDAVAVYKNQFRLAQALGISHQAVYQWPWDDPIPLLQQYRLKYEINPNEFKDVDLCGTKEQPA